MTIKCSGGAVNWKNALHSYRPPPLHFAFGKGWAISGPRLQRFQWTVEAFRTNLQISIFLQITTVNVAVEDNLNRDLLLFPFEGAALR